MSVIAEPPTTVYTKDFPFRAKLLENRLLTRPGSSKETRHLVVDLRGSGLTYEAGDSLGVYPSNRPEEVNEILSRLGATGEELVSPAALRLPAPEPLRRVLSQSLALSKPHRRFVELLASRTQDPEETARFGRLLAPEAKDALTPFLEEREFVDLLIEFPNARPTPAEFVDQLRRLQPRLYSIASSPRVHPEEVHLTVAVVRYETNFRQRFGVCTTYFADRIALRKDEVPVFVASSHFGPPEDGARDCIMVGPGTGVAPFRAFVQDRVASGATGRNWLFFGDQHRKTDFLYEEEWNEHLTRGELHRLDTAFSRDQLQKVYVQDRLREHAAELWSWIQGGAHFYVCGDAKRMAKDVDVTLHTVIAQEGRMSPEAATDYVKQMKKEHRYQRDVY